MALYTNTLIIITTSSATAAVSVTTWVSRHQKGKTSLDLTEARGDGFFFDGGGISWTIRKQSAPRCRQITTPTPHRSIFTRRVPFLTPNRQRYNYYTYGDSDVILFHIYAV